MSGPSVFLLVVVICAAGLLAMYMPGRARNVPSPAEMGAISGSMGVAGSGQAGRPLSAGLGAFDRAEWDQYWQQEFADTLTSFPAIKAPIARPRYCPSCRYQTRADGHRKYCTGRLALTAGAR